MAGHPRLLRRRRGTEGCGAAPALPAPAAPRRRSCAVCRPVTQTSDHFRRWRAAGRRRRTLTFSGAAWCRYSLAIRREVAVGRRYLCVTARILSASPVWGRQRSSGGGDEIDEERNTAGSLGEAGGRRNICRPSASSTQRRWGWTLLCLCGDQHRDREQRRLRVSARTTQWGRRANPPRAIRDLPYLAWSDAGAAFPEEKDSAAAGRRRPPYRTSASSALAQERRSRYAVLDQVTVRVRRWPRLVTRVKVKQTLLKTDVASQQQQQRGSDVTSTPVELRGAEPASWRQLKAPALPPRPSPP